MKLKPYLVVVALLLYCCYCYSETISDRTANAASLGLTWTMQEVLPQYTGLTVGSVSYRYTAIKVPSDPFVVSVQNYSAQGSGYIFRSVDDWTGLPGNTITKTVLTDNIPINYWGPGEIRTQGVGSVSNPYVSYGFKYDTCKLTPVTDTSCANYRPPLPDVKIPEAVYETPPLQQAVQSDTEQNATKFQEPQTSEKRAASSSSKTTNSLVTAQAAAQAAAFEALNNIPDFKLYSVALPGGVYQETIKYTSKVLPDSRNSQRLNLSQQRLHNTMVESQYNLRK